MVGSATGTVVGNAEGRNLASAIDFDTTVIDGREIVVVTEAREYLLCPHCKLVRFRSMNYLAMEAWSTSKMTSHWATPTAARLIQQIN